MMVDHVIELAGYLKANRETKMTSKQLGFKFNIDRAVVRELTQEARRRGFPIATDTQGYWYEPNYQRYMDSLNHLKSRAMSQLRTIKLAEQNCILAGQLNLDL